MAENVVNAERGLNVLISEKMYKTKFKDWGIEKHLRSKDVLAAMEQIARRNGSGEPSEIIIRNRRVLVSDIERHVKRNPLLRKKLETGQNALNMDASGINCRTASPNIVELSVMTGRNGAHHTCVGTSVCLRCKILNLEVSSLS